MAIIAAYDLIILKAEFFIPVIEGVSFVIFNVYVHLASDSAC
jgi:hypothetical protein